MSNYRERREAGHYELGTSTQTPEPDETPFVDDEDDTEPETDLSKKREEMLKRVVHDFDNE